MHIKLSTIFYIFYFTLTWNDALASATWWLLHVRPAVDSEQIRNTKSAKAYCDSLRFLKESEVEFCVNHPTLMHKISEGVKSGIRECQFQFRYSKWNCSTYQASQRHHPFKPIIKSPTREAAYVHSIIAASVTYEVTKACSGGDLLDECACAKNKKSVLEVLRHHRISVPAATDTVNWGGCSDDIRFGEAVSRQFLDGKLLNSTKLSTKNLIKLHNGEAGRRAVRTKDKFVCKCHGLSGACTQTVCWKTMPPLRAVSHYLKEQYDGAILVKAKRRKKKFRPKLANHKKPTSSDLIYSQKSRTDFCNKNLKLGSYGTQGRICNATSRGNDGCSVMCCDRPKQTRQVLRTYDCNCTFEWCCKLNCQTCSEMVSESRCL